MSNGYDSWGNPQFQPQAQPQPQPQPQSQPQYQNAMFTPVAYPNNHQQHRQHQQQQHHLQNNQHQHQHNAHPHQHMLQPQPQPQHQQQHQQQHQPHPHPHPHMQAHNANYQFQSYDPSFDQRPWNMNQPAHMMPSTQQPVQPPIQQVPNQHHHYPQQMDWQRMPPPMSMPMPSPTPAYHHPQHPHQHQHQPQPLPQSQILSQHQSPIAQHVNSPIAAQSPQMPQHHVPNHHHHRVSTASARPDHTNRVSASPRLTSQAVTRSPSVSSTRSPAQTPALIPHHLDTNSLLICVAEEFFEKARKSSLDVAETVNAQSLHEYQKLVATGLGCLEVALQSNKLAPRLEARIRLRYASILCEETNNVMEAETALTKGITLCERNRFADLKYLMQFLQVKLLFSQRKERAAMIAVDGRIRDAEVLKHTHWIYAFRFLKASFYLQTANPTEAHALENLKAIVMLASQRGDRAVYVAASLLEGLSLLRNMKDDAFVRIQACIAQASKYQLDNSVHILQLYVLALILDLACSLHQKSPKEIVLKLKALQNRMDTSINDPSWSFSDTKLLLPISKQSNSLQIISDDTSGILRPGPEGDPHDYLAMSFWTKLEAFALTYTYSGLALLYQQPRSDKRMFSLWEEGLTQFRRSGDKMRGTPNSMEEAIRSKDWQREMKCYLYILRGLHFATSTRWDEVKKCITELERMVKPALGNIVVLYSMYLTGVYHQGTGDLATANMIYSEHFGLDADDTSHSSRKPAELDVSLLATFNRIWIMQEPSYRNDRLTLELLEQLRPLCTDHPNLEIRTAYNLVLAAIQTNPPIPMTAVKTHISTALNNAKILGDVQTLSIALNLMRAKLFQSIVGDQALKSAKAASTQAKKSGNLLWMSVASGMLAQSYDVQGQGFEASSSWQDAIKYRTQAFKHDEA
ncbi:cohesin loading factor-domain-containing protein [Biscogniauxia mediterranea]|nr:cohesin loading factor-domain-containing protein [Biscogniauxia mediterranea]